MDENNESLSVHSARRSRAREAVDTKFGCQRRYQLNAMLTIVHQVHGDINKRRPRSLTGTFATRDFTLFFTLLLTICTPKIFCNSIRTSHEHVSVDSISPRFIDSTNWKSQSGRESNIFTSNYQHHDSYPSSRSKRSYFDSNPIPDQQVSTTNSKLGHSRRPKSLTESSRFMMFEQGNEESSHDHNMKNIIQRLENNQKVADQIFNQTATMITPLALDSSTPNKRRQPRSDKIIRSEVPAAMVSNLTNAGVSNRSQYQSRDQENSNERINVKHRYTFTVNGKELSLQPPSTSSLNIVDLNPNSSIPSESNAPFLKNLESSLGGRKKVNRIGDFVNPDYESGFEVSSGPESESSPPPTTSRNGGFNGRQYPINSGVTKGRSSAQAQSSSVPPSSSSSSLMSPSRHNGEDNYSDNEDSPFSSTALSTSYENNISHSPSTGRNVELGKQDSSPDFGGGNKIISDWPKSDSNRQLSAKSDRHSSKSANSLSAVNDKALATKIQNQGSGSKFSTTFNLSNNEGANQSGEQQSVIRAWDVKQPFPPDQTGSNKPPKVSTKTLASSKSAASVDTSAASHDNDSSSFRKASSKRNIYPRAPVYAKTRYSSQVQPDHSSSDSTINGGFSEITGSKSTNVKQNSRQPVRVELAVAKESNFQNDNDHRNSHPHNQDRQQVAMPTSTPSNEVVSTVRSARFDKSINGPIGSKISNMDSSSTSSIIPPRQDPLSTNGAYNSVEHNHNPNSISEYKTNFTAQPTSSKHTHAQQKVTDGSGGTQTNDRKSEAVKKSHIAQRDLSKKMPPFLPSTFVLPSRGGFKPAEPKIINPRNSGRAPTPIESLKNIMLNESTGANSLQRVSTSDSNGYANDRSLVRTGPLLPNPLASYSQLRALMPGLFMRDIQDDYQAQAATNQFRAILTGHSLASSGQSGQVMAGNDYPYSRSTSTATNQNLSGADQMLATSNQHSVAHLGPRTAMGSNMGESSNYNSIASLQDYPERQMPNHDQMPNGQESNLNSNAQPSNTNSIANDEHSRGGYNEADQSSFEPNASVRSSTQNPSQSDQAPTNSRSSVSDVYLRTEHKNRGDGAGTYPIRGSADPFEDIASGLSTVEYERDLADLDEEFNRHSSYRRPSNPLMSDSLLTMSPERYEARRFNRRPSFDYTGEYLNTAGSISSIIPRPYQRSHAPWSSSSAYSDNSDLWADTSVDYNPLASFVSPSHYTYRWRPRYQRVSPYSTSPYLATSASEQHLQPAYNIIPSYTSAVPTETISYALSPLAAAAAAAASALVAADKTRHHNHGWLALPRLAAGSTISPTPTAASASTQHASTLPAGAIQTAYIHRPSPYALGSVPIYAIAPRPAAPLTTAASGATASIIPYFHGGAPTIIAYRPAGMVPSTSLLAAHSFAYPLRLPVSTIHRPGALTLAAAPTRSVGRPFYSDLAFAESKSKTNLTSTSSEGKGLVRGGSLTAMAKNLTKKMFGSASQIRPQHVAPPSTIFEQYATSQNSSAIPLSSPMAI